MIDTVPKPVWMKLPHSPTDYAEINFDTIKFDKIKFKGYPPVFHDENNIFEESVEELSIIRAIIPCGSISTEEKEIKYLRFNEIQYCKVSETVYLENIDFRVDNNRLILGSLKLDSSTTRESMAKIFPKSFEWRNFGINWVPSLLKPEDSENFSFMVIRDAKSQHLMRLNFLNHRLFYCDFSYECM